MAQRNSVSRLGGDLIARKGEAAPTPGPVMPAAPPVAPPAAASAAAIEAEPPRGLNGTIAVTVRLDPERYERLKVYGARRRRTNQDILVAALDAYFADKT